jgi:hypothetical protein
MAVAVSSDAFEHRAITRWVLVVESNLVRQHRIWHALEGQGFGVVTVATVEEARGCLAVMRPAFVVAGDLPGAGDLLDGARAVGIEAASYRDIVGKQLA